MVSSSIIYIIQQRCIANLNIPSFAFRCPVNDHLNLHETDRFIQLVAASAACLPTLFLRNPVVAQAEHGYD
jgi:hypothetical protein